MESLPTSPQQKSHIFSLNRSEHKGEAKTAINEAYLDLEGMVSDAHRGHWHRQISLLAKEEIDAFATQHDRTFAPGAFGENITTLGLDYEKLALLDRIDVGDCQLTITQFGKSCHGPKCSISQQVGTCIMPTEGVFARVLKPGTVRVGEKLSHHPHYLVIKVITLSDRAAKGIYVDQSGPLIQRMLHDFLVPRRWRIKVEPTLLPDNKEQLHECLTNAIKQQPAIIFTTGGTGIGPNDITPEVVVPLLDKTTPGIMDYIRSKYGDQLPAALLSRAVAGVAGQTLIYALPGSPRAVGQYMEEILKATEHSLFMLHQIDNH